MNPHPSQPTFLHKTQVSEFLCLVPSRLEGWITLNAMAKQITTQEMGRDDLFEVIVVNGPSPFLQCWRLNHGHCLIGYKTLLSSDMAFNKVIAKSDTEIAVKMVSQGSKGTVEI